MSMYSYREVIIPKKCEWCGKRTRYVVEKTIYESTPTHYCSERCARAKVLDERNTKDEGDALTRRILA